LARCYTDFVLLLYYITDRMQLGDDEDSRRRRLLEKIELAAHAGVDCIQLRERDLTARELERLATQAVEVVRRAESKTKLLINSRVDVALAAGADGVHLRSDDMAASEARAIWAKSAGRADCTIAVSCHSLEEVLRAEAHGADFVVLGPVFGKQGSVEPPLGVEAIARTVRRGGPVDHKVEAGQTLRMPAIALGGITVENAATCLRAGAAGLAGIRLFQDGDVTETVARLRSS
jgi:thiamine-phosphate pyrophosphorylase